MRTFTAGIAALLLTAVLALAAAAQAQAAIVLPADCLTDETSQAFQGVRQDCIALKFTQTPDATTTETTASFAWDAAAVFAGETFGIDAFSNLKCTLGEIKNDVIVNEVTVDCADGKKLLTGLKPGEYVFRVEMQGFVTSGECSTTFGPLINDCGSIAEPKILGRAGGTDEAKVALCGDGSYISEVGKYATCFVVSDEYTWKVNEQPKPVETPVVVTPAPVVTPPAPVVAAAPKPACTSRRTLTIRIRERKGAAVSSAKVRFNGKTIATSRRTKDGRLVATIDFRKLPAGRFSVQIEAKLADGSTRTYTRRYFTCEPKRPPSNNLGSPQALGASF